MAGKAPKAYALSKFCRIESGGTLQMWRPCLPKIGRDGPEAGAMCSNEEFTRSSDCLQYHINGLPLSKFKKE
jgi:hypothetical protein